MGQLKFIILIHLFFIFRLFHYVVFVEFLRRNNLVDPSISRYYSLQNYLYRFLNKDGYKNNSLM